MWMLRPACWLLDRCHLTTGQRASRLGCAVVEGAVLRDISCYCSLTAAGISDVNIDFFVNPDIEF